MNNQAGIFEGNSKTPNSTRSLLGLLCLNFYIHFGSCPPGRCMFHVTEAGHANLCGVVGCFRGEKPPLRDVGPLEQSQRDHRRPLAQPKHLQRLKKNKGLRKPRFASLFAVPNHTSTNQATTPLKSSIAVSLFGYEPAHPRDPKSDGLLTGASQRKQFTGSRGALGRTLAVARVVGTLSMGVC